MAKETATKKTTRKKTTRKAATKKASTSKRVTLLDAAATVLSDANEPLSVREIYGRITEKGLWSSPGGRTPSATLYSAMTREIGTKGKESRFKKVDRGLFASGG